MSKYLLIISFVIGIFFRLFLSELIPQYFAFDQKEYHEVALDLLGDKSNMYTASYRLYGYPLLLAIIYRFFGMENTFVWKFVQAAMDTTCALLVIWMAKKIFEKEEKKAAYISYLLCLFNPYTTAYVGVRMTEVMTIMFMTLTFFVFLLFLKRKKLYILLLLASILGYTPQIRPGFLYFTLAVMAIIIYWIIKRALAWKKKLLVIVIAFCLYAAPFSFNIARNLIYFQEFSLLTVDNLFVREFYISLFIANADTISSYPPEVHMIYQEFSTAPDTKAREQINRKYLDLAKTEIKKDPEKFIVSRIKKMFYVWEKHNLFPYTNPNDPFVNFFVYWGNILLLFLALLGYVLWVRKGMLRWFAFLFLFFIIYISIIHAFTITAERFSLPAYPLLCLFAGYGIFRLFKRFLFSQFRFLCYR